MIERSPIRITLHAVDKLVIIITRVSAFGTSRDRLHLHRIVDHVTPLDHLLVSLLRQARIVPSQVNRSASMWRVAVDHLIAALPLLEPSLVLLSGLGTDQRFSALLWRGGRANAMNLFPMLLLLLEELLALRLFHHLSLEH